MSDNDPVRSAAPVSPAALNGGYHVAFLADALFAALAGVLRTHANTGTDADAVGRDRACVP